MMKVYKIQWMPDDYVYLFGEETLKFYDIKFKVIKEIRMPRPTFKGAIDDLLEDIRYLKHNKAAPQIIVPLTDLAKKWLFVEEEKQDAHTDENK